MKRQTSDRIFVFFRSILKLLLVHSFIILFTAFGFYILEKLFVESNTNILSLTYYGFAIFAALSNICFSYSRTFDEKEHQSYLRSIGGRFLYSTIGFLIGSLLNYIKLNGKNFFNPSISLSSIVEVTSQFLSGLFFFAAFIQAAITIHSLLNFLFEQVYLNKYNYLRESNDDD